MFVMPSVGFHYHCFTTTIMNRTDTRRAAFIAALLLLSVLSGGSALAREPGWALLSRFGPPFPDLNAVHFLSDSVGLVCGGMSSGSGRLYRTTNGGISWSEIALPATPRTLNDIFFLPGTGFGVTVGDERYIAITYDSGATWRALDLGTAWGSGGDVLAVRFTTELRGFVVGRSGTSSGPRFAATADGGATWKAVPQSGAANNLYDIDFFDQDHGIAVGTGKLARKSASSDGGGSWEANAVMGIGQVVNGDSASVSMYGVCALPGGTGYAAGGKVYYPTPIFAEVRKTTDFGRTWSTTALSGPVAGNVRPAYDVTAASPMVAFVSTTRGTVYRTMNGGGFWSMESLPGDVSNSDLRRFQRLPNGTIHLVGTRGVLLRYRPVVSLALPVDTLRAGPFCPGDSFIVTIPARNAGTTGLRIGEIELQLDERPVPFKVVRPVLDLDAGMGDSIRITARIPHDLRQSICRGSIVVKVEGEENAVATWFELVMGQGKIALDPKGIPLRIEPTLQGSTTTATLVLPLLSGPNCPGMIDSVRIAGGEEFDLVTAPSGLTIPIGMRPGIVVVFGPVDKCERWDTVLVYADGGSTPLAVPIVGTGIERTKRVVGSDTIEFGDVEIGTTVERRLVVGNRADLVCGAPIRILGAVIGGPDSGVFTLATQPGSNEIMAGDTSVLSIAGVPHGPGPLRATLVLTYNVTGDESGRMTTDTVTLVMNGLTPEPIDMELTIRQEPTRIGSRTVTITSSLLYNRTSRRISVDSMRIEGPDAPAFLVEPDRSLLEPGEHLGLMTAFRPTHRGEHAARARITTSVGEIVLDLSGLGTYPKLVLEGMSSNPITARAGASELVPVSITNTGDAWCRIDVVSPIGSGQFRFEGLKNGSVTLAAGETMEFMLRFAPMRPSADPVRIVLHGDGVSPDVTRSDTSLVIPAVGTAPVVVVSNSTIDAGRVRIGESASLRLDELVRNDVRIESGVDCSAPVVIDSVTIQGDEESVFILEEPVPGAFPARLDPGASLMGAIRFAPGSPGAKDALLAIYFDGSRDSVRYIRLAGEGIRVSKADLGGPVNAVTGSTISIPVMARREILPPVIDSLELEITYSGTLLRPLRVRSDIFAARPEVFHTVGARGRTRIRFGGPIDTSRCVISGGGQSDDDRVLAVIDFAVLRGDTTRTSIVLDSITIPTRPDLMFGRDSVVFTATEVCDPSSSGLSFRKPISLSMTPNPARGPATLFMSLPASGHVRIGLHNALGEEVLRLYDGPLSSGSHSLTFDTEELTERFYYACLIHDTACIIHPIQVVR